MDYNLSQIENKKVKILAYSVSDRVLENIERILRLILENRRCEELYSPIYTCLKELLVNAVKANFKNIYFEGYTHFDKPDNPISYELGLKLFKLEMSRENAEYLSAIARKEDKKAEVMFNIIDNELKISVTNPVAMTAIEQENVNRKLNDARMCDDISDYFMKIEDDPNQEGAGLGLVLISIMLKNLGVTEDNFSIFSDENQTTASISIPLTQDTKEKFQSNL